MCMQKVTSLVLLYIPCSQFWFIMLYMLSCSDVNTRQKDIEDKDADFEKETAKIQAKVYSIIHVLMQ